MPLGVLIRQDRIAIFAAILLCGLRSTALAANSSWIGGDAAGPNSWSDPFNWSGSVPNSSTATALFAAGASTTTVNALSATTVQGLSFTASGYSLTFQSTFTVGSGGISATTANAPNLDLTVNGDLQMGGNVTVANLTGNGLISASSPTATGTLIVVGTSANFTGLIENGPDVISLKVGDGTNAASLSLGDIFALSPNRYTGATLVNANATLIGATTESLSGSSAFTLNGTLDISLASATLQSLSGASTGLVKLGADTLTVSNGGTYAGAISGTGGSLAVTGGTLALSGASTYSGTTTISNGQLTVGNNSALGSSVVNVSGGTLQINPGFTLSNTITLSGGNLAEGIASGTQFSSLHSYTSNISGGTPTRATLLGGQSSAAATITGSFTKLSAALNDGIRVSDVFNFNGVTVLNGTTGQTDTYVLQLQINPSLVNSGSYLAWLNPGTNTWVNAVIGNIGGTMTFINGAYNAATDNQLGYYGVDTTNGDVWAVVDYDASFSVVPEPSTWLLLGLGLGALSLGLRRNKRAL